MGGKPERQAANKFVVEVRCSRFVVRARCTCPMLLVFGPYPWLPPPAPLPKHLPRETQGFMVSLRPIWRPDDPPPASSHTAAGHLGLGARQGGLAPRAQRRPVLPPRDLVLLTFSPPSSFPPSTSPLPPPLGRGGHTLSRAAIPLFPRVLLSRR